MFKKCIFFYYLIFSVYEIVPSNKENKKLLSYFNEFDKLYETFSHDNKNSKNPFAQEYRQQMQKILKTPLSQFKKIDVITFKKFISLQKKLARIKMENTSHPKDFILKNHSLFLDFLKHPLPLL